MTRALQTRLLRVRRVCCAGICAAGISLLHAAPSFGGTYLEPGAHGNDADEASAQLRGGLRPRGIASGATGEFEQTGAAPVSVSSAWIFPQYAVNADPDTSMTINGVEFSVEPAPRMHYAPPLGGGADIDRDYPVTSEEEPARAPLTANNRSGKGRVLQQLAMSAPEEDPIPTDIRILYHRSSAALQSLGVGGGSRGDSQGELLRNVDSSRGSPDAPGTGSFDPKAAVAQIFRLVRIALRFWDGVDPVALAVLGILVLPLAITAPVAFVARRNMRRTARKIARDLSSRRPSVSRERAPVTRSLATRVRNPT